MKVYGVKANVDGETEKSNCEHHQQQHKRTRGFLRAQRKRALLRGMVPNDALIVAMDLAHRTHCVWISTVQKHPLDRFKIPNTASGMQTAVDRALRIQEHAGLGKIVFAMEPTGHYWMSVASYLQHQHHCYVLIQPLSVKRERESTYYRYAKSDFRDAELVANLTADRKFTLTQLPSDSVWANLKAAATEYVLTDMMLTTEHLRLHAFLERLYPEYPTVFKNVTSLTALACWDSIRALPAHSQAPLGQAEFLAEVRAHSTRRIDSSKVLQFYELATCSHRLWGTPIYEQGLRLPIAHAAKRYQLLVQQHQEVEQELLSFYDQTGYAPYANTMPHLSAALHAAALGFTGDPDQFDSSRCLTKFAGVDIKENESGDYHGQTPITRRGDPLLRYVAYLAGFILKTHDGVFQQRYHHLVCRASRPLKKNQAIVALGCKYLRILWTLCTQRVFYDPEKAEEGIKLAKHQSGAASFPELLRS